jgi:cellulose synthase/poly-beta-1,6-N-acetylglucosamine synthase-like glycosyltransferase
MKYLILCAILILHGLHRAYSAFKPSHFLSFIGSVALVLIACYTFYPAFRNVEGELGCTVTILAGEDSKNQRGKFQIVQFIDLNVRHKTILYSQSQSNLVYTDNILSLVVPAYNEAERLPLMLDVTLEYLNRNRKNITQHFNAVSRCRPSELLIRCEFIIVNDGSTDDTESVVRKYALENVKDGDIVKLLSMHKNCGKGGAVKMGMLQSSGKLCLMVDADGATDIADGLPKMLDGMKDLVGGKNRRESANSFLSPAAVFGSRAHLEEESSASRSKIRTFLMHSFHFFVKILCSPRIKDTQCGFKLFTRSAAVLLFTNLHLRRW